LPKKSKTAVPESTGPVTIEDIAQAAGVHAASVSRALRGVPGKVSAKTRDRITQIAKDLGYQPNAVAASLRTKQSNLVAIVVPDVGNPLFGPIVQGLEAELRRNGYMSLMVQPPDDPNERRAIILALANRHISGLLILAAESDDPMLLAVAERSLPAVLVNRGFGERRFSSVVNDDRESVRLVLEHLASLGHTRVAHISGPLASSTGRARRDAFVELAPAFGIQRAIVVEAAAFTRPARAGLRHARPPRHGDHQLRARRRSWRTRTRMGNVIGHPARRRAAHERGHGRAAQRVQPRQGPDHAFPADLDRAQRHAASSRATSRSRFAEADKRGKLRLVASPDGAEGSVLIHADARVYAGPVRRRRKAGLRWTRRARPTCTWCAASSRPSTARSWRPATPPS
jgi:hypothetical protein